MSLRVRSAFKRTHTSKRTHMKHRCAYKRAHSRKRRHVRLRVLNRGRLEFETLEISQVRAEREREKEKKRKREREREREREGGRERECVLLNAHAMLHVFSY